MEIANSRILVTGGAAGLGLIFVEGFLQLGAKVAIFDYNKDNLKKLLNKKLLIKSFNCDVSNYEQVDKTFAKLEKQWGVPDVLINNAGIIYNSPLYNPLDRSQKKHSPEEWQKVIDVNLSGTFNVTNNWVEQVISKRKKGIVINISSVCAKGNAGQSAYSASKAGIEALTKTWAKELGPRGIRSVAIAPGYTNSGGTKNMVRSNILTHIVENTPIRRLGEPIEVFSAVKFVIENDFINGSILSLDGGLSI
jgi:3-oxoacyl-[acyl-carrier protein] reductase